VLVIAERGLGKTHLLQTIQEAFADNAYFISVLQPAKGELKNALIQIMGWDEEDIKNNKLSRKTTKEIAEMLTAELGAREGYVLIIDTLDKVTATISEILTTMAEKLTLLGAVRQIPPSEHLKRFFWSFRHKVQLQPLADEDLEQIIQEQIKQDRIAFQNQAVKRVFIYKTVQAAGGVPLAAIDICKDAKGTNQVTKTFVAKIKPHDSAVKYIDATPLFIIALAFILALRYLSRGMGNYDAFILTSSIGIFCYTVGRFLIFRYFSQRKR
jgi:replication-associated recombination protein RarA